MTVLPATAQTRDLFVYVDESGNFDFSPSGTAWYYITALSTAGNAAASKRRLAARAHTMPCVAMTDGSMLPSVDEFWC